MPISPDGIENVSLSGSGVAGDGHSISVTAMSADGRYVVFASQADNLADGSSSGFQQIFRKDMLTGEVVLVSSSADGVVGIGASDNPSITGDGRYVVFDSAAGNLVAGDTGGHRDIFLKDCLTGAVTRVSEFGGAGGDGQSMQAAISADGNYVVFTSVASNLTGEGNGEYQILLWDRSDGSFKPLSLATDDGLGNGLSRAPDISGDGRFVVFQSQASNLSNLDDSSFYTDIFLWDRTTDDLTLVSTGPTHQSASSYGPYVSDDGAVVSFYSDATNLVAGPDTNTAADAFVYYTSGGSIVRVSETADGQIGSGLSIAGPVSNETSEGDRYVILRTGSTNFPDSSGINQVFAKNLTTGELTNISQGFSAGGGSVSQDGKFFTFFAEFDGLIVGDTNGFADIFQLGHDGVLDATISVSADQPSVTEGNSGITDYIFTLTRGGELIGESSVDYAVTGTGANAADAGDFAGGVFPGGTLTFGYGQTELTLTIGIAGDTIVEPDEGFIVTLSNPDNAVIGTNTASGIIANDDGGGASAAPVALDLDIGSIGSGVDLVVNVADIVTELAFDADTDLSASDISFTAATIDGVPITLADLGFGYVAGPGDAGSFSISAAFAHLLEGESADVVVTFTVSDGTSTDTGELIYTVVGGDLSYDATLDFLGVTVADQEVVAESIAGAGETKLDIAVTGSITLEDIFAALDLTAEAGNAVVDILTDPDLTVAASFASNDSAATATAQDGSQAGAFATDGSTATAGAADGSNAIATADDTSIAIATASDGSSSRSTADNESNAEATATDGSDATAIADNESESTANAAEGSSATAVSDADSEATATATANSDATAIGTDMSNATAAAVANSSSSASANDDSIASAQSSDNSVAVANADGGSTGEAVAIDSSVASASGTNASDAFAGSAGSSAATASADSESDASAIAYDGSAAQATATDVADATSVATSASVATATADDGSSSFATADRSSAATAFAAANAVSEADAEVNSLANAVAVDVSDANASAANNSDALAAGVSGSAAAAEADLSSSASAIADLGAEALAVAEQSSTAVAFASGETTGNADPDASAHASNFSAAFAYALGDSGTSAHADSHTAAFAGAAYDSIAAADSHGFADYGTNALILEIVARVTVGKAQAADFAMNTITTYISSFAPSPHPTIAPLLEGWIDGDIDISGVATGIRDGAASYAAAKDGSVATADADAANALASAVDASAGGALASGGNTVIVQADSVAANAGGTIPAFVGTGAPIEITADGTGFSGGTLVYDLFAATDDTGYAATRGGPVPLPLSITPQGSATSIQQVVLSGFPAGTVLSAGTPNGAGTAFIFDEAPPADLTMTLPASASDFVLTVTVTDESGIASATQIVDLPPLSGGGGGGGGGGNPVPPPSTITPNAVTIVVTPGGGSGTSVVHGNPATIDELQIAGSVILGDHLENVVLKGTGPYTVHGNDLDNVIYGNSGDNVFYGSGGRDHIDGGTGFDRVVFEGRAEDYAVAFAAPNVTVTRLSDGAVTTLSGIQQIEFDDQAFPLFAVDHAEVYALYLTFLDRSPEAEGFAFWMEQSLDGLDLVTVTAFFTGSAEFLARQEAEDMAAIIETFYERVLLRAPEDAGLEFWQSFLQDSGDYLSMAIGFVESTEFNTGIDTILSRNDWLEVA